MKRRNFLSLAAVTALAPQLPAPALAAPSQPLPQEVAELISVEYSKRYLVSGYRLPGGAIFHKHQPRGPHNSPSPGGGWVRYDPQPDTYRDLLPEEMDKDGHPCEWEFCAPAKVVA